MSAPGINDILLYDAAPSPLNIYAYGLTTRLEKRDFLIEFAENVYIFQIPGIERKLVCATKVSIWQIV